MLFHLIIPPPPPIVNIKQASMHLQSMELSHQQWTPILRRQKKKTFPLSKRHERVLLLPRVWLFRVVVAAAAIRGRAHFRRWRRRCTRQARGDACTTTGGGDGRPRGGTDGGNDAAARDGRQSRVISHDVEKAKNSGRDFRGRNGDSRRLRHADFHAFRFNIFAFHRRLLRPRLLTLHFEKRRLLLDNYRQRRGSMGGRRDDGRRRGVDR